MDIQNDILTEDVTLLHRRRPLLPLWIKIFIWIFLVLGVMGPIIFAIGMIAGNFQVSMFGFETTEPLSVEGLLIGSIFIYNGVIAYLLWTERTDAIDIAMYGAYLSVALCITSMVIAILNGNLSIRLELVPLIFYINKLKKIKEPWLLGVRAVQPMARI